MLKLKYGCNISNGIEALNFIHGFQRLLLYSTSSIPAEIKPSQSLAKYLVETLGFSSQQSLSTSTKISQPRKSSKTKKVSDDCKLISKANLVINFFKQIGFDEFQIRKIIGTVPLIVLSNVEKTLKPKIELLQGIGINGSDLSRAISSSPSLLCMRLNPLIQTLRQVLGSEESLGRILRSSFVYHRQGFWQFHKNLIPNVKLLEKYGIPYDIIQKHVVQDPKSFIVNPLVFEDVLITAEQKFEISRDSRMFLYAVCILRRYSEKTIESKFQVYKSFGWAQSDILTMMRRNPSCLGLSEALTKKKLDFFMSELGYQPADLVSRSAFMTCSLEKRVMPRHQVLLVLKEKGLIKMNHSFYTTILLTESRFVNEFVLPYVEVLEVYANRVGVGAKLLTQGRANAHAKI